MRRSIVFAAVPALGLGLGLGGCANLPFMQPQRNYVVFFQPDSAALRAPGLAVIGKAAHAASLDAIARVSVTGAADTDGSTPDNIRLSSARASAVAAQLIADGVAANRVEAQGLGPVGSPPASEQASRTATIVVGR